MKKLLTSPWALLGAIFLMRLPGFAFGVLNVDESDFLVFGASILRGLIPYRDLVEIKPPLGYFTYALAGGLSIGPIRVLGVLWVFATAMLLRAAARRWTGSEEAGWAAAWLSLVAGIVEVPSFGSELMMNLPIAAALLALTRGQRARDVFACGFFIGVASLYRHQAAVAAFSVAIALLVEWRRRPLRGLSQLAVLAAGTLLPWVIAAGAYGAIGQLPAFLDWTIGRNLEYASNGRAGSALARGATSTVVCLAATAVPWAFAARESLRPRADVIWRALTLLLWLTWIPVALGGRFYEHYYLQFVPPLAILAAPGVADLVLRWRELLPRSRVLALTGVLVPVVLWTSYCWARGFAGGYASQEPRTGSLARWLRSNTASADTLFVWGHYTPIYTLSQRLPGTRYVNTSVHMGNFDPLHLTNGFDPTRHRSQRDIEATLEDLDRRRPAWFVDTAPADIHGWGRLPLSAFPELLHYREQHYVEVARPGGAAVYRRVDAPAKEAASIEGLSVKRLDP